MNKKPLFQEPIIISLLLLFFWPLGMILLWKYGGMSKKVKLLISSFILFLFLLSVLLFFSLMWIIVQGTQGTREDTSTPGAYTQYTVEEVNADLDGFYDSVMEDCMDKGIYEDGCDCLHYYYNVNHKLSDFLTDFDNLLNDKPHSERLVAGFKYCNDEYNSGTDKFLNELEVGDSMEVKKIEVDLFESVR